MTTDNPIAPSRSDVKGLPDYVLSAPTLADWSDVEAHFQRQWAESILAPAQAIGPEAVDRAISYIDKQLPTRPCAMNTERFGSMALAIGNLPYLLWVTLRKAHPGITQSKAKSLLNDDNTLAVREAVLSLFGFNFTTREDGPKNEDGPAATETAAGANPMTSQSSGQTSGTSA